MKNATEPAFFTPSLDNKSESGLAGTGTLSSSTGSPDSSGLLGLFDHTIYKIGARSPLNPPHTS